MVDEGFAPEDWERKRIDATELDATKPKSATREGIDATNSTISPKVQSS
jgi:hypothetical protein